MGWPILRGKLSWRALKRLARRRAQDEGEAVLAEACAQPPRLLPRAPRPSRRGFLMGLSALVGLASAMPAWATTAPSLYGTPASNTTNGTGNCDVSITIPNTGGVNLMLIADVFWEKASTAPDTPIVTLGVGGTAFTLIGLAHVTVPGLFRFYFPNPTPGTYTVRSSCPAANQWARQLVQVSCWQDCRTNTAPTITAGTSGFSGTVTETTNVTVANSLIISSIIVNDNAGVTTLTPTETAVGAQIDQGTNASARSSYFQASSTGNNTMTWTVGANSTAGCVSNLLLEPYVLANQGLVGTDVDDWRGFAIGDTNYADVAGTYTEAPGDTCVKVQSRVVYGVGGAEAVTWSDLTGSPVCSGGVWSGRAAVPSTKLPTPSSGNALPVFEFRGLDGSNNELWTVSGSHRFMVGYAIATCGSSTGAHIFYEAHNDGSLTASLYITMFGDGNGQETGSGNTQIPNAWRQATGPWIATANYLATHPAIDAPIIAICGAASGSGFNNWDNTAGNDTDVTPNEDYATTLLSALSTLRIATLKGLIFHGCFQTSGTYADAAEARSKVKIPRNSLTAALSLPNLPMVLINLRPQIGEDDTQVALYRRAAELDLADNTYGDGANIYLGGVTIDCTISSGHIADADERTKVCPRLARSIARYFFGLNVECRGPVPVAARYVGDGKFRLRYKLMNPSAKTLILTDRGSGSNPFVVKSPDGATTRTFSSVRVATSRELEIVTTDGKRGDDLWPFMVADTTGLRYFVSDDVALA